MYICVEWEAENTNKSSQVFGEGKYISVCKVVRRWTCVPVVQNKNIENFGIYQTAVTDQFIPKQVFLKYIILNQNESKQLDSREFSI